jgi:hypothetical protein
MKFKALDLVKITQGFFQGQTAIVVNHNELFGAPYYRVRFTDDTLNSALGTKGFQEIELELNQ